LTFRLYFKKDDSGTWNEVAKLSAKDRQEYDHFGKSVSLCQDYLLVGAYEEDGGAGNPAEDGGAVYLFGQVDDKWQQLFRVYPNDLQQEDYFGYSICLGEDHAVISAPLEDGGVGNTLEDSGAMYILDMLK
jgi:hypothetical protein